MGEVTRTLYDAVYDAFRSKSNKKGIIMSIDFEKAFDSVAHSLMLRATELAGRQARKCLIGFAFS